MMEPMRWPASFLHMSPLEISALHRKTTCYLASPMVNSTVRANIDGSEVPSVLSVHPTTCLLYQVASLSQGNCGASAGSFPGSCDLPPFQRLT